MRKRLTFIAISVVMGAGVCMIYFAGLKDRETERHAATNPKAETSAQANRSSDTIKTDQSAAGPQSEQSPSSTTPGAYVDYRDGIVAQTSGTKLLFFHAPWCSQCRSIDADIRKTNVPTNVTIIKVDYDSNQGLRQKYGVTLQTTVVKIDDAGNLVKKFVAYEDPTLAAITKELL